VRHLTAAEPQGDLGLVPFLKKADQIAQLDLIVAFISPGTKLNFLNLYLLLLPLRRMGFLVRLEQELPVIDDPAHRWLGRR
jgi:hypothetical protein